MVREFLSPSSAKLGKTARMTSVARLLVPVLIVLTGCGGAREKARDVAVTTFRVIDTPARYVRNRIDESEGQTTTTTTTETATSDVVTPGRPVAPAPQRPVTPPARTTTAATATTSPAPRATPRPTASGTASASQRQASTPPAPAGTPAAEFPTAKAVPDKPGFVLSPYDGAFVDVTGFKSGDKARDPKTRQIFIVP